MPSRAFVVIHCLGRLTSVLSQSVTQPFGANRSLIFSPVASNPYGGLGQWLLQEEPLPRDGSESMVTLFARSASISKPRFYALPCRDSKADLQQLRKYITNSFRAADFSKRHCGRREIKCGRIVLDNALEDDLLVEAYEFKDRLHAWEGIEIVQRLLEHHFRTGSLRPVGGQLDHNIRSDMECEMHSDYLSRPPHYFLTAILYLVDQGKECEPCETVFNDAVESGRLAKGAVIQPRRGRLVLFSGGMENMHCKMPSHGRRDVVQMWFQCASEAGTTRAPDL